MAGIYLHIPFCKKACHYCDFHFSTSPLYKPEMLIAMHTEIALQKDYLKGETVETIYFGGGTPSLLQPDEIQLFIDEIGKYNSISSDAEITLEANPDDLTPQKVKELKQTPVNRFSIGIQSFFEEDLHWMNRAHNSSEALSSIKRVQDAGFENITADLIYGYPLLSDEKWKSNIKNLVELNVPHISAYSMTVEPQTALASFIRKGKQHAMSESQSANQFMLLMELLGDANFEHYEISNFARQGLYSRHNTNYWNGVPYLGIGPSAHSFNTEIRQWNIANNAKYITSITQKSIPAEWELLSLKDKVNEYIMTSLRTMWGLNLEKIKKDFGEQCRFEIEQGLEEFAYKNWVLLSNNVAKLTTEGKLFADHISSQLFVEGVEN